MAATIPPNTAMPATTHRTSWSVQMVLWLPGAELQPANAAEMAIATNVERNELTGITLFPRIDRKCSRRIKSVYGAYLALGR